jgi:hypothetical protein
MRSRISSDLIAGIQMRAVRIEKLLRIKRFRLAEPFEVTLRVFQTIATLTLLRARQLQTTSMQLQAVHLPAVL